MDVEVARGHVFVLVSTELTEFVFLSFATAFLATVHLANFYVAATTDYFAAVVAGYFFGGHLFLSVTCTAGGVNDIMCTWSWGDGIGRHAAFRAL